MSKLHSDQYGKPKSVSMQDIKIYIGRHDIGWIRYHWLEADLFVDRFFKPDNVDGCSITLHSDYVFLVSRNNIPLQGGHIDPIELPVNGTVPDLTLKTARLVGWGEVHSNEGRSTWLKYSDMTIQPDDYCRNALNHSSYGSDYKQGSTLCGYSDHSGCPGDSGGPVQYWAENRWVLIGIFSEILLDQSQDLTFCGPNRLMLIKRIPLNWKELVMRTNNQIQFGLPPQRDGFKRRLSYARRRHY